MAQIKDMNTMKGKVCMVTGASSGIGKVTAKDLAVRGATVVLVCRNKAKGEAVREEIIKGSANKKIELIVADLSSMKQVRAAAATFKKTHDRLDVLINNAGTYLVSRVVTDEGNEATFATNVLAPMLLSTLLYDTLRASASGRVIMVSSEGHRFVRGLSFGNLQGEKKFRGGLIYSASKLALTMLTYELARKWKDTGVTVNAVHPGAIFSNFAQDDGGILGVGMKVGKFVLRKPESGAEPLVHLATSHDVAGLTGLYFRRLKPVKSSKVSMNVALQKKLWNAVMPLTGMAEQ